MTSRPTNVPTLPPSTGLVTAPQTPASLSPVRSNSNGSQANQLSVGPPSIPPPGGQVTSHPPPTILLKNTPADDLDFASDLNFEPAAIIDGQGPNQDDLDVSDDLVVTFVVIQR